MAMFNSYVSLPEGILSSNNRFLLEKFNWNPETGKARKTYPQQWVFSTGIVDRYIMTGWWFGT